MTVPQPKLSAPDLILSLLDSAPQPQIKAASLVAAGALFGIDPRAIRVAVTRLVKGDVLATVSRGIYSVGDRGDRLHRAVVSWSDVDSSTKPWKGGWLAVYQAHIKRADKTARRARERALRLQGFAAVDAAFAVRPANLRRCLTEIRAGLIELGLDAAASVFLIEETEPAAGFEALWDAKALEARYANHIRNLQLSTDRVSGLDVYQAAAETLLIGRGVTRDIVMDPLLPPQLVDAELRGEMIKAMRAYDRLGKECWRRFYAALEP